MRGLMLAGSLIIATVEPVLGDQDPVRYAISQGGLLAVVCVVLFFYRRDFLKAAEKQAEEKSVLMDLVRANTAALAHMTDALIASQQATERLSGVVDKLRNKE